MLQLAANNERGIQLTMTESETTDYGTTHDFLGLEYTQLTGGIYRVVDEETGYVVFYAAGDGKVKQITPVPIRDGEVSAHE